MATAQPQHRFRIIAVRVAEHLIVGIAAARTVLCTVRLLALRRITVSVAAAAAAWRRLAVMLVLVVVLVHNVLVHGVRVMVLLHLQRHMDEDAFLAVTAASFYCGTEDEQQHRKTAYGLEMFRVRRLTLSFQWQI